MTIAETKPKRLQWRLVVLCAFGITACGSDTPTTPQPKTGFTLQGVVLVEGNSLTVQGATVSVADGAFAGKSTTTDADGRYMMTGLSGGMTLVATANGFREQSKPATITSDTTVDFELTQVRNTIRGRITNIVTGGTLPGITISAPGQTTTSGADGTYRLETTDSGMVPISFRGPGVFERETAVSVNSTVVADVRLIPMGDGFDMGFYNHVFRANGMVGTRRWVEEPRYEIWTREFECLAADAIGACTRMRGTDEQASATFQALARRAIATDVPQLTGGFLGGAPIRNVDHAPGTIITRAEQHPDGVISIALVSTRFSDVSFALSSSLDNGVMRSAHVQINDEHKDVACTYAHEVAHTLGYLHPNGSNNVPRNSVMRPCEEVSDIDRLHGRILYLRPPGSLAPDRDPPG